MRELRVSAPDGVGEVTEGTDLAALVLRHCALADGDVLVVTSKVVSKAEGRVRVATDDAYREALARESVRLVARRGGVRILRHRLGLVMAAAGIDRSNVTAGSMVLLPVDPDASARRLRADLLARAGRNVAVVVTDTAGRAWRVGQTDIAIGVAGLRPVEDHAGATDAYGNPLLVTAPAVADEIAGAAELTQGKLGGRPLAVLRGREDLVLPAGDDGPGASALLRDEGEDLFGYGAREAVLAALAGRDGARAVFGAAVPAAELVAVLQALLGDTPEVVAAPAAPPAEASADQPLLLRLAPHADRTAVGAAAFAHGWELAGWHSDRSAVRARLVCPGP